MFCFAFADAKVLWILPVLVIALESRPRTYDYAKIYAVGLMLIFNQSQTATTNTQSDVLRTKYDYIFKIKILEFLFWIHLSKTIYHVKTVANRWSSSTCAALIGFKSLSGIRTRDTEVKSLKSIL
jgi:hypothetical protein